jgi:DUF971 family protein
LNTLLNAQTVVLLEILFRNQTGELCMRWSDDTTTTLTFAQVRGNCRCAECSSVRRQGTAVCVAHGIQITDVMPMGASAVQLCFSDGHMRGIFPFAYMRSLAETVPQL